MHLAAPGENIWSTWPGGKYEQISGTSSECPHTLSARVLLLFVCRRPARSFRSFLHRWPSLPSPGPMPLAVSTPHVSGAIALYASRYPAATPEQIRSALLDSVTVDTARLTNIVLTKGRLNVGNMLTQVPPVTCTVSTRARPPTAVAAAACSSAGPGSLLTRLCVTPVPTSPPSLPLLRAQATCNADQYCQGSLCLSCASNCLSCTGLSTCSACAAGYATPATQCTTRACNPACASDAYCTLGGTPAGDTCTPCTAWGAQW